MAYIISLINVLTGMITGRAFVNKDWVTFSISIILFISFLVYDCMRCYKKDE